MVGRIFKKNNSCFCYKTLWISHVRLLVEPGYRKESWISKEGDTARTNFSSPGRVNGSTVFYIASKMPKKREDSPLPPSIPSFLPSFPSFTFKTEDITNWKKREYPPSYRPPQPALPHPQHLTVGGPFSWSVGSHLDEDRQCVRILSSPLSLKCMPRCCYGNLLVLRLPSTQAWCFSSDHQFPSFYFGFTFSGYK